MPTYEYACRDCGEHLEVVQSFKDDPLTECGRCGGQLRKVFSAAGIIFKGSGYYVTDSRSKSDADSRSKSDADSRSKSGSDSRSETGSSDGVTASSTSGDAASSSSSSSDDAAKSA
ncbi:MAG: FmdB family transcriptional regulator [Nitriliruptorales bacterium]|nr:FmdB family transcriptional regulator [Nitriliruptorales bacterium]